MNNANAHASEQSQEEAGSLIGTCPMQAPEIDIVPVRYAIDEEDENGFAKHGLPDPWVGNGIFAEQLTKSEYTLRQLRDGWLYVISEDSKTLHEYEVKGKTFTQYDLGKWFAEFGKTERGTPGQSNPFISYSQDDTIYLAWSKIRWTWRLFDYVLSNPTKCRSWMRKLHLPTFAKTLQGEHIGLGKNLSDVADISPSISDAAMFVGHITQTKPPEKIEGETVDVEVKPVASVGDFCSGMCDVKSSLYIALDDPFCDLQELSIALGREALANQILQDDKLTKYELMEMTAKVIEVHSSQHISPPPDVVTPEQRKIYSDRLTTYYKKVIEVETYLSSVRFGTSSRSANATIHRTYQKLEKEKAQLLNDFKANYPSINPNDEGHLKRWRDTQKWRDEIDINALRNDTEAFERDELPLLQESADKVEEYAAQLRLSLDAFGWEPERGFVDNQSLEAQYFLSKVHQYIHSGIILILNENTMAWIEREFDSPTTLYPLYLTGFSRDLSLGLKEMMPGETDLLTAHDFDEVSSTLDKFVEVLSAPSVTETAFYKTLSNSLQSVWDAFSEAIRSESGSTVSVIGRKAASIIFLLSRNQNFQWYNLIAEKVATNKRIEYNKKQTKQLQQWKKRISNLSAEIRRLEFKTHVASNGAYSPAGSIGEVSEHSKILKERYQTDVQKKEALLNEYERTLKETIDDHPTTFTVDEKDFTAEFKNKVKELALDGKAATAKHFEHLGGGGFIVLLLNVIDLSLAFKSAKDSVVLSQRTLLELTQKMGYTAAALGSIIQGKAWNNVKSSMTQRKFDKLAARSISKALDMSPSASLSKFVSMTRFVSVANIYAVANELIYVFNDFRKAEGVEEYLHTAKGISLTASGLISMLQLATTTSRAFWGIGLITSAWLTGALFLAGVVYIISTLILSSLRKDDYQKWLRQLPWGEEPNDRWTLENPEGIANALLSLYVLTRRPKLTVVKDGICTFRSVSHSSIIGMDKIETPIIEKIIIYVDFPDFVNSSEVEVIVHEPFYSMHHRGNWNYSSNNYEISFSLDEIPEGKFDIEVRFYLVTDKKSRLYRKTSYRYVFLYSELNLKNIIPPLSADDKELYLEDLRLNKTRDQSLIKYRNQPKYTRIVTSR